MDADPHAHRPQLAERWLQATTLALLLLAAASQLLAPPPEVAPDSAARPAAPPDAAAELQAQYLLGLHAITGVGGDASSGLDGLLSAAGTPAERLRLVALSLALGDRPWAEAAIERVRAGGEVDAETLGAFDRLLGATARGGAPDPFAPGVAERLEDEHGWFGALAVALAAGEVGPVEDRAARTAVILGGLLFLGLLLLVAGTGLSLVAYRRWRAGEIPSGYRRALIPGHDAAADGGPTLDRTPYLETLLLAIVGLQVLGVAVVLTVGVDGDGAFGRWPLLLNWLLLPMLLWPLVRGAGRADFFQALGWNRGRGVLVEAGCGLLGYLTAAPLLLFGFLCSTLIAGVLDQPPHHPILDWIQGAGWVELALVASVAVLWAPVVEESLFRGVFYHYLRGRSGPALSAFLVSLAFAAIHPQGLAGIPFLVSLAMALAFMREWRGSLIAPITVHLVHNGLVMTLLFSLI